MKNSPFLTVILVCTGDEEVHGTPFDQRINEFFLNWRQQQLEARTPFVIALRAQAGVLEGFAVTLDVNSASTVKGFVVIEFTEE